MNVPFLHESGAGLVVTRHAAHLGVYTTRGTRPLGLRLLSAPLQDAPASNAWTSALRAMCTGCRAPDVAVAHVPPALARMAIAHGPGFDDARALAAWLDIEAGELLPPGGTSGDYVLRHHVVSRTDTATHAIVAAVHREAVARVRDGCARAGLRLAGLSVLALDVGSALGAEATFAGAPVAVWVGDATSGMLIGYRGGLPEIVESDVEHDAVPARMRRLMRVLQPPPGHLLVLHLDGEPGIEALRERLPAIEIAPAAAPAGNPAAGGAACAAAALAMRARHAELGTIDFLPGGESDAVRQAHDRRQAACLAGSVGAVLLGCLLLVAGARVWLDRAEARAVHLRQAVEQQRASLDASRHRLAALSARVHRAQVLLGARTRMAAITEQVARQVPADAWLDALDAGAEADAAGTTVVVRGGASAQSALASLLDALEAMPLANGVELTYARAVPPPAAEPGPRTGGRVAFELRLVLSTGAAPAASPAGAGPP